MIILENVSKSYTVDKVTVNALINVSVQIAQGEFVSITGPSGGGKTTLLLTMGGLNQPDSGKIYIKEKSVYDLSAIQKAECRRNTIGFLFQTFNLIPYLTALENVQIPLYMADKSKDAQEKKAKELLDRFGLASRMNHRPPKLSVGQQQRVALARALANDPQIILADEPTGNLDPDMTRELMDYLKKLTVEGSVTIVMVTHNHDIAGEATRHMRLAGGRIEEIDAPSRQQGALRN
ncbi:MAG: ABC transporter ATP-binding protein [Candidatus Eremiobacteraeota bacterium]|nr:ABC transporter ATP-binding protein [Candidatus Eremiobacteraeota bacterium]